MSFFIIDLHPESYATERGYGALPIQNRVFIEQIDNLFQWGIDRGEIVMPPTFELFEKLMNVFYDETILKTS